MNQPDRNDVPANQAPTRADGERKPQRRRCRTHIRESPPRELKILRGVTVGMVCLIAFMASIMLSGTLRQTILPTYYDPNDTQRLPDARRSPPEGGDQTDGEGLVTINQPQSGETAGPGGERSAEPSPLPAAFCEEDTQRAAEAETTHGEKDPDTPGGTADTLPAEPTAGDGESRPEAQSAEEETRGESPSGTETAPFEEESSGEEPSEEADPQDGSGDREPGGIWYGSSLHAEGLIFEPTGSDTCSVVGLGSCTDACLVIPAYSPSGERVTSIAPRAFFGCATLTSVSIPAGVTSIGQLAFAACPNLAYISVDADNPAYISPDGVLFTRDKTVLLQRPPARKNGLAVIPAEVAVIDVMAFYGARGLCTVVYDGTEEDWMRIYIGLGNNALSAAEVIFR